MRDPGLLPGDAVDIAVLHGPGGERSKIRARIGLGEHGSRQYLAAPDLGQPFLLLRIGAGVQDQLLGNLGARAERADADITAAELLGDDTHRLLTEPEAAILLWQREGEYSKLAHLGDQRQRNVFILEVP